MDATSPKFSALTVPQLKALCKEKKITGYSKLGKAALIEKLTTHGSRTLTTAADIATSKPSSSLPAAHSSPLNPTSPPFIEAQQTSELSTRVQQIPGEQSSALPACSGRSVPGDSFEASAAPQETGQQGIGHNGQAEMFAPHGLIQEM